MQRAFGLKKQEKQPYIMEMGFLRNKATAKFLLCAIGLLFLTILPFVGTTATPNAKVTDVVIKYSPEDFILSLKIANVFPSQLNMATLRGATITVYISAVLYKVRNLWMDRKIAQKITLNTVGYDVSNEAYKLLRSWEGNPDLVAKSLEHAQQLMAEFNNVKVMPLSKLQKGQKYQLRIRAICKQQGGALSKPEKCYGTDWYILDFSY